jgi:hypothetical protein
MLYGRVISGLVGADVFGRLDVSTPSAWSVLLSPLGNDKRHGLGAVGGC